MATITIRNVGVAFPSKSNRAVQALSGITLEITDNQFVAVIGPSGCGKSTLLRCVADLLSPSTGEITIDSAPAAQARQRREIGFVFQEAGLMPWRSATRNAELPLELSGAPAAQRRQTVGDLLKLVGLSGFGGHYPRELSGGMRQRVSIARTLSYNPKVLLMDEPFGALDEITREEMNQELLRIWEARKSTVVFVTHSISEALFLSDVVVVLSPRPGRIQAVHQVPFARPRQPSLKRSADFLALELTLLTELEGGMVHG